LKDWHGTLLTSEQAILAKEVSAHRPFNARSLSFIIV